MNILMVSDVFPNNVKPNLGTFCLERLKALKKYANVKVVAAVPYFPKLPFLKYFSKWHDFSKVHNFENICDTDIYHPRMIVIPKVGGSSSGWFYYLTLKRAVKDILKTYRIDLIDAHFVWPDGFAAAKVGEDFNIPVCITAHGTDINLMPTFQAIKPLIVRTIEKADRIIAVSQALANIMYDMECDRSKIRVINNGVDVSKFNKIDKKEARIKLDIKMDSKILLSIGALIPRKAHELLIKAVDLLVHSKKFKNIKLLIIGEGESRQELFNLIKKRKLENHVELIGQINHSELYKWLSASDLFCLSSKREGWPTVFFESWACGIPVIATNVHGAPEAICSEEYGMLIEKHDPELISNIMEKALLKNWNAETMIQYAHKNSWDNVVNKMYIEMEQIIKERSS